MNLQVGRVVIDSLLTEQARKRLGHKDIAQRMVLYLADDSIRVFLKLPHTLLKATDTFYFHYTFVNQEIPAP